MYRIIGVNRKIMIFKDLKAALDLRCGIDGSRFELVKGKYSLYRRCPKADVEQRDIDEIRCLNYLSPRDSGYILSELEILNESDRLSEGYKGRIFHLEYTIEEIATDYIRVSVFNNNILSRKSKTW